MPRVNSGEAIAQPIFQPVSENVLPSEDNVTVRSLMPGSDAIEMCEPLNTSRSYTSSENAIVSCSLHNAAINSSSSRVNTLPVGLCGELMRIARGLDANAARKSASGTAKSGGRNVMY